MIYFNGCSFTDGFELADKENSRFSKLVSDSFGQKEWNRSKIGSSNGRIWRTTMTDIMLKKPKLAVIMWSGPNRQETFHHARGKWMWGNVNWKEYKLDTRTWKLDPKCNIMPSWDMSDKYYRYLNGYLKEVMNYPWYFRYTLHYILSIKYFLKSQDIPFLFYSFSSTQYARYLEVLDWETWDSHSGDDVSIELSKEQVVKELPWIIEPGFYDLCLLNKLPIGPKDHPLEEGHKFMAKKIIKDIKKNGFHKRLD